MELVAGQEWVRFGTTTPSYQLLSEDLVQAEAPARIVGDVVPRAVVIHSPDKIRQVLRGILKG
jgi:hypothetical protein